LKRELENKKQTLEKILNPPLLSKQSNLAASQIGGSNSNLNSGSKDYRKSNFNTNSLVSAKKSESEIDSNIEANNKCKNFYF
jgi:hypothetical protein